MRGQKGTKLKWLLETVLPGRLVDTPTLERHGVTRMLAHKYIDSGWLEPVVRGLYRRPQSDSTGEDWQLVVRSLQHVMDYPSVIGGRTALEAQGFAHYLPMRGEQVIHLHGDGHPTWLKRLDSAERFRLHGTKLFALNAKEETTDVASPVGPLTCSTPERAILELLDEMPKHESIHIVDTAFEGMASARPRRLERLKTMPGRSNGTGGGDLHRHFDNRSRASSVKNADRLFVAASIRAIRALGNVIDTRSAAFETTTGSHATCPPSASTSSGRDGGGVSSPRS